jgi:hypothetical protein
MFGMFVMFFIFEESVVYCAPVPFGASYEGEAVFFV